MQILDLAARLYETGSWDLVFVVLILILMFRLFGFQASRDKKQLAVQNGIRGEQEPPVS